MQSKGSAARRACLLLPIALWFGVWGLGFVLLPRPRDARGCKEVMRPAARLALHDWRSEDQQASSPVSSRWNARSELSVVSTLRLVAGAQAHLGEFVRCSPREQARCEPSALAADKAISAWGRFYLALFGSNAHGCTSTLGNRASCRHYKA